MKTQKQLDADTELLTIDSPLSVFWHLAALATGLIVISTWLALLAAMVAGWLGWQSWLFCTAPVAVWLVVLALPVLFHARRGAVAVVAALASTAEAWLARAGYSIDLNNDGYIGWKDVSPTALPLPSAEIIRPVLVGGNYSLIESDAPAAFPSPAAPATAPQIWLLPNGVKLPQGTVESFVDGVFIRGLSRDVWVGPKLPLAREQYDGLVDLLAQTGLLIGRTAGTTGRLAVHTPEAARAHLKLSQVEKQL
jgi:hypothetical protein